MPTVINVEYDRIFDTHYLAITYSDNTKRVIEIEEGAEFGKEETDRWEKVGL